MSMSEPIELEAPDLGGFVVVHPDRLKIYQLYTGDLSERDKGFFEGLLAAYGITANWPFGAPVLEGEFATWTIDLKPEQKP